MDLSKNDTEGYLRTFTWSAGSYKYMLNVEQDKIQLVVVDIFSKDAWMTDLIDAKSASVITEGLWHDPLTTLVNMIRDAFDKSSEVNFKLTKVLLHFYQ